MAEGPVEHAAQELIDFIEMYREAGPRPILWVGAGASAAAGYPTLWQLETALKKRLRGVDASGFELLDAFIAKYGPTALENELQTHLGQHRRFVGLHASIARLASARLFRAIFTTNYDELIEDALKAAAVGFLPQVLEMNFSLQGREDLLILKLHGSQVDWASVVLSGESYRAFRDSYPLLHNQLDLNLRIHPRIFVGCSMRDPRILDWLRALPEPKRRRLLPGRVLITEKDWGKLPADEQALLASANIRPILVETHADIAAVLERVARRLAPLDPEELIFDLAPDEDTWRMVGPTPESPPHEIPNPLKDRSFVADLVALREQACWPVIVGRPDADALEREVHAVALRLGRRLTEVLLSDKARASVARRIHENARRARARLSLRVVGSGEAADRALALPWELIMPEPDVFAVQQGALDLVREAVTDGAHGLDAPTEPLALTVSIAAPDGAGALRYEDEAFRLYRSLVPLGHRVTFTDLGDVDDLVHTAAAVRTTVIHFSGHGLPGQLVFEDEYGLADVVKVGDVVHKLNVQLNQSGDAKPFPRLFFLASCHGASGDPEHGDRHDGCRSDDERSARALDAALGHGPSTTATLHRSGFVQVLGYFGPISDALSTRAEERFYGALGQGRTTLQATAEARESLCEEIALGDVRARFPFAWTQLALYHRGPDLPLARQANAGAVPLPERFRRKTVEVSGLPVLEHGFIGRRSLQHLVRRKVMKEGRRLLVLQGLGGLGKTALASHLVSRVFAHDPVDVLILPCGNLDAKTSDPASVLWQWAEEHGRIHNIAGWDATAKALRETNPAPTVGFEQTVRLLRKARPRLVVYADNLETLQDGPLNDDPKALGDFLPAAVPCKQALERLADEGVVLISTRYRWRGLDVGALMPIEPMKPADVRRMIETFEHLGRAPHRVQDRIAERADGHPRTVEYLDRLVGKELGELDEEPEDWWKELIAPLLPRNAEAITSDLLLDALWARLSDGAQAHARALTVLRQPAPREVVDALGSKATAGELIRAGVLTLFREQSVGADGKAKWVERWGMHGLVTVFVGGKVMEDERRAAHQSAGAAYGVWVKQPGARWSEQEDGIFHLHAVGEGDQAWPMVQQYALWLRHKARYREALRVLAGCEAAGTARERLSAALMLIAQMRMNLGERSREIGKLLERALGLAESDERRGYVLHEQGSFLQEQGKYGEAEALLRKSLALKEKALGVDHPEYGASLHALAGVLQAQGKYGEAEALLRTSLVLVEKALGVEHPSYGASLHALAGVLQAQGKYGEAEALLRKSLAIDEKALGVEHPSYGASLHELAGVLRAQGKYDEAEALLSKSLALVEKALGVEHPSYGASLHELAGVLRAQGKYGEAEALLRKSLALKEKALGVEHPEYGASLHELAGVLRAQGKYGEAEALLRKSLALKEKALGVEHPSYGASLHELAGVLRAQGKYGEAEALLRKSLAIDEKALGVEHPSYGASLHELAGVLRAQGKYDEAEALLSKSLALVEKALGVEHPSYGASLHELAGVLRAQGKYGEAEALLRKSLALKEKALGVEHPSYGASLNNLAGVLHDQGKFNEAEAVLKQAVANAEKSLGSDHPDLCPRLMNLGAILAEQGRAAEGEPFIQRALGIARAAHGSDHPDTAQILNILAQNQAAMGKPEARDTAREAISALLKSLGPDHPITRQVAPILQQIASGAVTGPAPSSPAADLMAQVQEGQAALEDDDPRRAATLLTQAADNARTHGIPALEASACGMLAQALFLLGQRDEALAQARHALGIAKQLKQEEAAQHFQALIQAMESAGSTAGNADPPDWNARIHAAWEQANAGDPSAASQALVQIAEEAHKAGAPEPEESARIFLAQIFLFKNGDRARAAAELRRALAIAEQRGNKDAAEQIRVLLAHAERT